MATALITGGTAGLGLALATALVDDGWDVVVTGRDPDRLRVAEEALGPRAVGVRGDVADPAHRAALADVAGAVDLYVANASTLGASPLPRVLDLGADVLEALWRTNVVAPVELLALLRPSMPDGSAVLAVTSDVTTAHHPTWGGYAASKAALEQLVLTVAAEDPALRCWAVDPGDLRTQMHQDAFPGEDISDRPLPGTVVPALLRLVSDRPPSGRVRAADLLERAGA